MGGNTVDLSVRQSELIKAMRFPLIVLVLYEHSVRPYLAPMLWSMDGANIFHFITEMVSHFFCPIAVCWFFFFSGFLFYHNLEEGLFSLKWISHKWSRRIHTVLIPHLLWNLLNVLAILVITQIFHLLGIGITSDQMEFVRKGPLYWFFTGPIDFPLWYLRDLIVMSLLAPIFYYPIKECPWISLTVLLILYLISFAINLPLFPTFPIFGFGAWLSIRKKNIIVACRKIKYPAGVFAFILLPLATAFYGKDTIFDNFFRLIFFPFGMITFLNICDKLYDVDRFRKLMLKLSETVFFIYAAHEIYILGWTKGLFLRIFGETLAARWISYLFVPVVTLAICLILFYLLKRVMPRTLSFACGWRTFHKETYSKYEQKYL